MKESLGSDRSRTEPASSEGGWKAASLGHGSFATTHWSVVAQAREASPENESALQFLCQTYWYPLYVYVRRQGRTPEDAQDLVQGFFAHVLEKRCFQAADHEKGKFRSFLIGALKRYMATEWDRANRLKRGGGKQIISLDDAQTEDRYLAEPPDNNTPEKAFERQWARTLLDQVLARLESEFALAGKTPLYERLRVFINGDSKELSYSETGEKLGMSEGAVKVAVYRLRITYRELLREEIARTIENPKDVEDEIRHLFSALS